MQLYIKRSVENTSKGSLLFHRTFSFYHLESHLYEGKVCIFKKRLRKRVVSIYTITVNWGLNVIMEGECLIDSKCTINVPYSYFNYKN